MIWFFFMYLLLYLEIPHLIRNILPQIPNVNRQSSGFWCTIHLWFRLMEGLQAKSMTSLRYRAVTRWRICVTMATLWQQQDGGYALLRKRYGNNKMAVMRYYVLHLQQYSHRLNLFCFSCTGYWITYRKIKFHDITETNEINFQTMKKWRQKCRHFSEMMPSINTTSHGI